MALNQPKTQVTVLHSSDNHIDTLPTCEALGKLVDKANDLGVDLVLLAGDFFDNNRVDDEVVEITIQHLGRLEMPVVLLPGNHDQLDQYSVYNRAGFTDLPNNLHLLRSPEGETITFPDIMVRVWGRPTVDHTLSFHPLAMTPPRDGPWWHIGIVHGFFVPDGVENERSSPIMAHEIEDTDYDYIALGHSDVFEELSQGQVKAAFSGAPVLNQDGSKLGSVAVVKFDPSNGVNISKVSLL